MSAQINERIDKPLPSAAGGAAPGKPRFALFVATAFGLGYLPKAPGTWGSLAGLLLALLPSCVAVGGTLPMRSLWDLFLGNNTFWSTGWTVYPATSGHIDSLLLLQCSLALLTGAIGVWSASRASRFWAQKDPQRVVIDEVSGQHLTYVLGLMPLLLSKIDASNPDFVGYGFLFAWRLLHWKYLLLGLILFRVFDIWKPFPVRQAESLPGGWGIMADDWVAAIYAAIGLWVARAAGI